MPQGVYSITHVATNKPYIGSTKNTKIRWRRHRNSLRRGDHHCSHLQRAWNKHGEKAFEFRLLEEVDRAEELLSHEQQWMDKFPARYNTCPKAGSPLGMKLTQEQRDKISAANSGRPKSDEARAAMSEGQRRRATRPEEQRRIKQFAMNRLGKTNTLSHRENAATAIRAALAKKPPRTGGLNAAARRCALGAQTFSCVKEAVEKTGLSKYKLKLHQDFRYLT